MPTPQKSLLQLLDYLQHKCSTQASVGIGEGQWGRTKATPQVHLRLEQVQEKEMDGQVKIYPSKSPWNGLFLPSCYIMLILTGFPVLTGEGNDVRYPADQHCLP